MMYGPDLPSAKREDLVAFYPRYPSKVIRKVPNRKYLTIVLIQEQALHRDFRLGF
jgi:hypothetical protein